MHFLLIEDSVVEANLLMEALRNSPLPARLSVVGSGDSILAYLRQQGDYRRVTRPDLILWSLSDPAAKVLPVLCELSDDPTLRMIPVVLLGNPRSGITDQRQDAFTNVQIVPKPIGLHDYIALMNEIAAWCQNTSQTHSSHVFFERDTLREPFNDRGVVSFSRELRGMRNRAKERASIS